MNEEMQMRYHEHSRKQRQANRRVKNSKVEDSEYNPIDDFPNMFDDYSSGDVFYGYCSDK